MARHEPNRKSLAVALVAAFLAVTLLVGALAILFGGQVRQKAQQLAQENAMPAVSEPSGSQEGISSQPQEGPGPEQEAPEASSQPQQEPEEPAPVVFSYPDELRAAVVTPGQDFLTGGETGRAAVASQLDRAVENAGAYSLNTIILDTRGTAGAIYPSQVRPTLGLEIDCVDYLASKARDAGLYFYAIYDLAPLEGEEASLEQAAQGVAEFVETYQPDGLLLSGYQTQEGAGDYLDYLASGGGMGYRNYQCQTPEALLRTAAEASRQAASNTQVGLLADAVWENASADPEGSDTSAAYTSLGSGHADTRRYVQEGLFDFVMVDNPGSTASATAPFGTVAQWWADTVSGTDTLLYMLHDAQAAASVSAEQLTAQVISAQEVSGISGDAFAPLNGLVANTASASTLVQYLNDEINEQWVLTQLAVTTPTQLTFTTQEQTVTFQGASDPQAEVTINGDLVPTNESGYFTIREDLQPGLNTFVIAHKGRSYTYNITREVQVIREVSPTGSISVDGDMQVTVTALAYEDATVVASIGGQQVTLSVADTFGDEVDPNSGYLLYTGVFTAPSASNTATQLGTITFTGTARGETQTVQGASVTINKRAVMGEGAVVYVTADQAETFPIDTINDQSDADYFPLPKGTMDKTYGDEIVYQGVNGNGQPVTKRYWKLESGLRVYSTDIQATNSAMPSQNEISAMSVKSSGAYTNVALRTAQKVPYTVDYNGSSLVFKFAYTARVPEEITFQENALFSDASWSGSSLTLTLKVPGSFLGYKASYEGDVLTLRFNNSPGGLEGARIVVDPGHGGNDPGTLGFYPGKDEADINLSVARELVSELQRRGATVLMVDQGTTMASRLAAARAFNPQILVSLHCNSSATNSSARGTEVYYFYPFQKTLASTLSSQISSALGTTNRGAKDGLYYMTRESQFACVLAEMGFVSNEAEYTRLINSGYQQEIASSIASGLERYLASIYSGGDYEEDTGSEEEEDEKDEEPDEDAVLVEEIEIEEEDGLDRVEIGDRLTLTASVSPSDADNPDVKWTTQDDDLIQLSHEDGESCKVEGLRNGVAVVRATARDSGHAVATYEIRVGTGDEDDNEEEEDPEPEEGVLIRSIEIEGPKTLEVGGSRGEYTVKVTPSNAEDPGVRWEVIGGEDCVILSNETDSSCKLEGIEPGTVKLEARGYGDNEEVYQVLRITVEE